MRHRISIILLSLALMIVLIACTTNPATPTPMPTETPVPTATPFPPLTTCLVTDLSDLNDGGFNQFAYEGMLAVVDDYDLNDPIILQSSEEDTYSDNIETCLEQDADVIVNVGFLQQDDAITGARNNPDVYFIGIDQDVSGLDDVPENYVGVVFSEDEAGFLVGALAALMANEEDSDIIAGVYGMEIPAVERFRKGYEQGALYVNSDWEIGTNILGAYNDSFSDAEAGIEDAEIFIEAGASVIFGAGGQLGSAAIVHAAQQEIYVIGVDQDEYFTTFDGGNIDGSEYIISSALKRVDQGVYDMIALLAERNYDNFPGGGIYRLDAARGGVGIASPHESDVPESVRNDVRDVLEGLISGNIETDVTLDDDAE